MRSSLRRANAEGVAEEIRARTSRTNTKRDARTGQRASGKPRTKKTSLFRSGYDNAGGDEQMCKQDSRHFLEEGC